METDKEVKSENDGPQNSISVTEMLQKVLANQSEMQQKLEDILKAISTSSLSLDTNSSKSSPTKNITREKIPSSLTHLLPPKAHLSRAPLSSSTSSDNSLQPKSDYAERSDNSETPTGGEQGLDSSTSKTAPAVRKATVRLKEIEAERQKKIELDAKKKSLLESILGKRIDDDAEDEKESN